MSEYDATDATRAALWEQLDALTANATQRIDRLLIGDEAFEHDAAIKAEIRRIEHERELESMRAIVRISRRNRGEE